MARLADVDAAEHVVLGDLRSIHPSSDPSMFGLAQSSRRPSSAEFYEREGNNLMSDKRTPRDPVA